MPIDPIWIGYLHHSPMTWEEYLTESPCIDQQIIRAQYDRDEEWLKAALELRDYYKSHKTTEPLVDLASLED